MEPKNDKTQKEVYKVDIYRETPVRLLGYANEVGESFRALVSVNIVRLSYLIASSYCLADTIDKSIKTSKQPFVDEREKIKQVSIQAADTLLWQGLASVAIPGFTINRICALSSFLLHNWSTFSKIKCKWITVAIGLASIPFIVKPIDHSVDYLMDESFRKFVTSN